MILVISDTHDNEKLSRKLVDKYSDKDVEALIHCGDVADFKLFETLNEITDNIYLVRGNNDKYSEETVKELNNAGVLYSIPPFSFVIEGYGNFVIMHEPYFIEEYINRRNVDFILYGHTHNAKFYEKNGKKIINPGALSYFLNPVPYYAVISDDSKVVLHKDIK